MGVGRACPTEPAGEVVSLAEGVNGARMGGWATRAQEIPEGLFGSTSSRVTGNIVDRISV